MTVGSTEVNSVGKTAISTMTTMITSEIQNSGLAAQVAPRVAQRRARLALLLRRVVDVAELADACRRGRLESGDRRTRILGHS